MAHRESTEPPAAMGEPELMEELAPLVVMEARERTEALELSVPLACMEPLEEPRQQASVVTVVVVPESTDPMEAPDTELRYSTDNPSHGSRTPMPC